MKISQFGFKRLLAVLNLLFPQNCIFLEETGGEANIFVVLALMILDLSIPRYALFVEFQQIFLIIILKMNLFVRYVGKVLISLIARDRWAFMITSCGN